MDIKTTFLNGVVEQEVNVEKTLTFETYDKQNHVCKLNEGFVQAQKEAMVQHMQLHDEIVDHLE